MSARRLLPLAVFFSASSARAELSTIAVDHVAALGVKVAHTSGHRPFSGSKAAYKQTTYWLESRGGLVGGGNTTALGTQLGLEYAIALGVTPKESDSFRGADVFGFMARLGAAMRAYSFNTPFDGSLVLHLSTELGWGGSLWWSDTARWSFLGGLRLAVKPAKKFRFELEYTLVPFVFSGNPSDLDVTHREHRVFATLGLGDVGVGLEVRLSEEETTRLSGPALSSSSQSWVLFVEWRLQ